MYCALVVRKRNLEGAETGAHQDHKCQSCDDVVIVIYLMIQPDVIAEAGAGRDEANRVSTRIHESFPNLVG